MFDRLYKLIDNVNEIDLNKICLEIWKDGKVQRVIIDLNRYEQLFKLGVDANGLVIGEYGYYSDFISDGVKAFGTHYTLNDTGVFYESMKVKDYNDGFSILADTVKQNKVGKVTDLAKKYGVDILGLTDQSKDEIIKKIIPIIITHTKELILA